MGRKIATFDGFVIVTPEYNHGTSGVLKNAIDYLYAEWNNKAVGFVSYGAVGGARAVEHLRLVAGEVQMADVRQQVALSLSTEFENYSVFKPGAYNLAALTRCSTRWSPGAPPSRHCAPLPWPPNDSCRRPVPKGRAPALLSSRGLRHHRPARSAKRQALAVAVLSTPAWALAAAPHPPEGTAPYADADAPR